MARVDKFIETESRTVVTRGWEKGEMGSYCLMFRVLVWDDKKFWRWMVVIAAPQCLNFTELYSWNGKFYMMYVLPQLEKKVFY